MPLTGCIIRQDIRRLATDGIGQWTNSARRGRWNVIAIRFCTAVAVQGHQGEAIAGETDIHVVPGATAKELVLGRHLGELDHRCLIDKQEADRLVRLILGGIQAHRVALYPYRNEGALQVGEHLQHAQHRRLVQPIAGKQGIGCIDPLGREERGILHFLI